MGDSEVMVTVIVSWHRSGRHVIADAPRSATHPRAIEPLEKSPERR
ncbi:hypothetical protein NVV95_01060 [Herbiconiux sp. CPCC 205716]|uniref:Uncharacterized protein n=1 Tax=Herbiconiux gentiana TaxID=2970912 RepID=A0ABT2GAA8_9MICO|nr:hypothetical protein [Herbiconiux gentiana]MCS5713133.1 hypothetical protein [Herbiconiux gentiana]